MTFSEMEATQWYEIYKERIAHDEKNVKSDFQLVATIIQGAFATLSAKFSQLRNRQPPTQSTLQLGGSTF